MKWEEKFKGEKSQLKFAAMQPQLIQIKFAR